jgi:hypothetical protein
MDNNTVISQIPICTRIYEYLNPKDKFEFRKVCKGVYKICPLIKYRWIITGPLKISGNEADNTQMFIFIESNPKNDPEIDKLLNVIEYLTFVPYSDSNKFTYIDISEYINKKLSQEINGSIQDFFKTTVYILSGNFSFSLEIPPESHLPGRSLVYLVYKLSNPPRILQKEVLNAWSKLLHCTVNPKWENICKHVEHFNFLEEISDDEST